MTVGCVWQGSSVGESARLIIVRSRVQAPLLLQIKTPGKSGVLSFLAHVLGVVNLRLAHILPTVARGVRADLLMQGTEVGLGPDLAGEVCGRLPVERV